MSRLPIAPLACALLLSVCAMMCCCVAPAYAQAASPATLTLTVDFPGDSPAHYTLAIAEDGSGIYTAAAPEAYRVGFQLSKRVVAPWFEHARTMHFFAGNFQSPRKVAFTGTKTLAYVGPDGNGSATFVYTENPMITRLSSELQQVALTLQVGQTLESHLRHQRMALDADLEEYQQALKDHMAAHPEAIAPALQSIVDSPDAMTRVSRMARSILSSSQP